MTKNQGLEASQETDPRGQAGPTTDPAAILENVPAIVMEVDEEGTVTYVNKTIEGYTREGVVGRKLFDFYPPEHHERQRKVLERVVSDGQPMQYDIEGPGPGGGTAVYRTRVAPVERDGEIVGATFVATDITDRRHAELELRSKAQQQAQVAQLGQKALRGMVLEELMDEVCQVVQSTLGTDRTAVLAAGETGDKMLLLSGVGMDRSLLGEAHAPTDVSGLSGYALATEGPVIAGDLEADDRIEDAGWIDGAPMRAGIAATVPGPRRPWGVLCTYAEHPRSFPRDDGAFLQALANVLGAAIERFRSEHEVRRLNQALEKRVADRTSDLEALNRQLEAFIHSVSHDLKGPLSVLDGYSTILENEHGEDLDEDGREVIDRIRATSKRISDLVDALLQLSRVNKQEIVTETVDVTALASELVDRISADEPARAVEVTVEDGITVNGDPRLVEVLLDNLLTNAWKFTAHEDPARISVRQADVDGRTIVTIEDNGVGFDVEDPAALFEPFERKHDRASFDGTGIGLATVRRIVRRHGGQVWAEGAPGEGATFQFTLDPAAAQA